MITHIVICTICQYNGIPTVIFIGKVTASAMGSNKPGFDLGAAIFMAAGTAIYDALAARIPKMNRLDASWVTSTLAQEKKQPLTSGTITANKNGNHPNEKKDFRFLPLVIPISSRNMAKNPG